MIYETKKIKTPTGEVLAIYGTDENGQVWVIPEDSSNAMYREYLESLTDVKTAR
jgi:hypothetical protein